MAEAHPTSSRSRLSLRTKLYIPLGRHHLVPRPRLSARLNESLARPLTLVSGPAGFGKTTLLSEWLLDLDVGESNLKRAWVSLDPGDNDPVRFLGYVIAALQTTVPDVGEAARASLAAPPPPPIESILAVLLNDLYALPGELILVLDNYHVINSAAVNNAVSFLLDNLPPQMHLILSTRADPSLPLALWRSRGQLVEIRTDELRFTLDEVTAFLRLAMGSSLSKEDIATLEARTEGWIAGLQMAALSMQGRTDVSDFIQDFKGSHRYIIDYLTDQVLDRQTEAVRAFLLQTCILDRMSEPLCNSRRGRKGSCPPFPVTVAGVVAHSSAVTKPCMK